MLYKKEIEDELMIQFIILYALSRADEAVAYTDLLNLIQGNCEINFTDLQLGLDNLIRTGHVTERKLDEMLTVYDVTQKGSYVIDFFYKQIPLIVREPIDKSIKTLYIEKRRREAVRASIEPINENEFDALCELCNDDKAVIMSLRLYAGERADAEKIAEYFKHNSADVYASVLSIFNNAKEDKENE